MSYRLKLPIILGLFTTTLSSACFSGEKTEMIFIDLLPVQKGVDQKRVEEYFPRVEPIVAKHGLKRVGSFKVTKR